MWYAIVLAGGSGSRMGAGKNKVLLELQGVPVITRAVKAFEGLVEGIAGDAPAVHGKKDGLSAVIAAESDVVPEPALHPPAFVVVGAGALARVLRPAPEAVDVELAHVVTDLFEVFDQFTVCHNCILA